MEIFSENMQILYRMTLNLRLHSPLFHYVMVSDPRIARTSVLML